MMSAERRARPGSISIGGSNSDLLQGGLGSLKRTNLTFIFWHDAALHGWYHFSVLDKLDFRSIRFVRTLRLRREHRRAADILRRR